MLMVISPAKTLDFESKPATQRFTQPQYLDHSQELIQQLRELTPAQISELMHVSDKIGGKADGKAVGDRKEDERRRERDQRGDHYFLKPVQQAQHVTPRGV